MFTETRDVSLDVMLTLHKSMKFNLHMMEQELCKALTLWQSKAEHGFKAQAICQVRDEEKLSLGEAMQKVDTFLSSIKLSTNG